MNTTNYPRCYTEPDEKAPGQEEFLASLKNMNKAHKTPLQEARCDAITAENQLRLGGLFCLWCGEGPMPSTCSCKSTRKATREEYAASNFSIEVVELQRWQIVHVHPCVQHNHCCPRSLCVGRCPDCGGCNQDPQDCKHFNPSGGPTHPDPSNTVSLPLCPRLSEDRTRCYREYQPPVFTEDEDMDETRPLQIRPDNLRTALILTGGRKEEEEEDVEKAKNVQIKETKKSKKKSKTKKIDKKNKSSTHTGKTKNYKSASANKLSKK